MAKYLCEICNRGWWIFIIHKVKLCEECYEKLGELK